MEMNSKLDTVLHQQQMMLQEMSKTRVKNTAQLLTGVLLPLQTVDQLQALDRQLQASSADKQALVCTCTSLTYHYQGGLLFASICSFLCCISASKSATKM